MKAIIFLCVLCGLAAADEQTAKQYFDVGAKAYAAQNFAAAAANFDEAYQALPMPEIAFSAAQAYRRLYRVDPDLKHVRRAVELYRFYLDNVKTGGRVGDASDNLGEMEREFDKRGGARIKVEANVAVERTRIGINVAKADQSLPGASALREVGEGTGSALVGVSTKLDGKQVEPFALIAVEPGDHVISVTADGYFPVEKKQRAVQGATVLAEVELVPKPARVSVVSEAGAKISVDGRSSGTTMLELAMGKHVITVTRRGRVPFGREVVVTRGQELTVAAPLAKTGRRRAMPWVLGGAGTLTVIATLTGIAAVVADGHASDARAQLAAGNASPTVADDYDRQVRRRDDLKTSALVFGAGALAASAVGIGLYLLDSPSTEGLRITPVAGPSGGSITIDRRF